MIPPKPADTPLVIGLLGGVAAGKSWIATALGDQGFRVIDADSEAREVVRDPAILAAIGERFGAELVRDGLDRTALAELVFDDPLARKELEEITHPAIRGRILDRLAAARAAGASVVLDVPLLLEGGLIEECDESVFVEVAQEIRQRIYNVTVGSPLMRHWHRLGSWEKFCNVQSPVQCQGGA